MKLNKVMENNALVVPEKGDIVVYTSEDGNVQLDVSVREETVWLKIEQIAELFRRDRTVIGRHISKIYAEGELNPESTCAKFAHMGNLGKQEYSPMYYNLDVIISVGYRVHSIQGTRFRQWATSILKQYMLRGYAFHQRFERLEYRMSKMEERQQEFDIQIRTALPPVEGIFFDGQIFDAYVFACDLIKRAQQRVVLIDNYVDESVLTLLDKRATDVKATIYTATISKQLQLDIAKHDAEFAPVEVKTFKQAHDRFLLIDDEVYHLGASLKDLGKKWFAFSRMNEITAAELIHRVAE